MAVTAAGTPYVESSDLLANYPGVSLALANHIDTIGKVLQVVSTTKTDTFSATSTTFTDVTGLSATITPTKTSNTIIVTVSIPYGHSANNNLMFTVRDASNNVLLSPASSGSRLSAFMAGIVNSVDTLRVASFTFRHAPSTTSAFTYKVSCATTGGTLFVNRSSTDSDNISYGRGVATVTLMEISA